MFCINKRNCYIPGICLLLSLNAGAQDMASPYSAYGIGDMDAHTYNMNAGMGYTGIALKSTIFSSGNNPASASGMEKSFLIFDFNAVGKIVGYHGNSIDATNSANKDFTIKGGSMAIKMNSFWASGIGFKQFSSVNYQFTTDQSIEGSNDKYTILYSGDGGLNEYYWNNAFNIGKHLALGVTSSFIAGPINQSESFIDNSGAAIESKRRDYYAHARFEYGAIYSRPVSKNWAASIGLKYSDKTKLNYERTLTVNEDGVAIINQKYIKYTTFNLPVSYGVGISVNNKKGMTIAADYSTQKWSALNYKGSGWKLVDANRLSAGVEFTSFVQTGYKVTQARSFQIGGYIDNSYLELNNHNISEFGITVGGKRSLQSGFLIGASLEAGVRGTTQSDLIKENYLKMTITFSFRDFIFSKGYKFK